MSRRDRDAVARGLADVFTGTDLLGSVIHSDRKRAGRPVFPSPDTAQAVELLPGRPSTPDDVMTGQTVIGEYDNATGGQADNGATKQRDRPTGPEVIGQADNPRDRADETPPRREARKKSAAAREPAGLVARRVAEGRRMADSPTTTVTLRVPRDLNDWLDEYIHRAWPQRVHKQDLVIEALRILFARRGRPGEPVLETELFPATAMTGPAGTFEQFLLWERASRDTLEVKRLYIDMAGDLVAGVVLSQIVYWHLPSREGTTRLRVEREGELWLAKGRTEWWDECRISPKQADRALELLRERGLIEVRLFKFGTAPTKHVRIRHEEFLRAWKAQVAGPADGDGTGGAGGPHFPQRSKSISTKRENRFSPKGEVDLPRRGKSLDTETTTETMTATASGPRPDPLPDGAAALLEELVSHGVGRAAARRLVRERPEVCRRCLEYLPYARVRTTRGAWLANAIRDEYGPPDAFERARARKEQGKPGSTRAGPDKAHQSHEDARRREVEARLKEAYGRLEEARGEAYAAFNEYVRQRRVRAERFVVHLSPRRREEHLAAFDAPEHRLLIFEEWLHCQDRPVGMAALTAEAAVPSNTGAMP